MATPCDVIIIGTGAGGGTLARHLAPSGKRILLLERGDWLPRELENCDAEAVFVKNGYISQDSWYDRGGKSFQPQVHYSVGGATKLYGAALYRQRKEDFGELHHEGGISPAWPISHLGMHPDHLIPRNVYMKNEIPLAGVAHQAGTVRFGKDPQSSVLDVTCKAHELDNLYVVDTSFFPSISAMNPALTAMANALRVGDHLLARLQ